MSECAHHSTCSPAWQPSLLLVHSLHILGSMSPAKSLIQSCHTLMVSAEGRTLFLLSLALSLHTVSLLYVLLTLDDETRRKASGSRIGSYRDSLRESLPAVCCLFWTRSICICSRFANWGKIAIFCAFCGEMERKVRNCMLNEWNKEEATDLLKFVRKEEITRKIHV